MIRVDGYVGLRYMIFLINCYWLWTKFQYQQELKDQFFLSLSFLLVGFFFFVVVFFFSCFVSIWRIYLILIFLIFYLCYYHCQRSGKGSVATNMFNTFIFFNFSWDVVHCRLSCFIFVFVCSFITWYGVRLWLIIEGLT